MGSEILRSEGRHTFLKIIFIRKNIILYIKKIRKAFNLIQLLTNEALEAKPRSILVFSGRYHIIYNASLVNNCFII